MYICIIQYKLMLRSHWLVIRYESYDWTFADDRGIFFLKFQAWIRCDGSRYVLIQYAI